MVFIVLVSPEGQENIGSVARAMMNMGFSRLSLVQPLCSHLTEITINYAVHAVEILKKAEIFPDLKSALEGSDLSIAISRRIGQWRKRDLTAENLAGFLQDYKDRNVHLVFGREKNGLTNSEINFCDLICSIPSDEKFPSLNLSQAVMIILYELFKMNKKKEVDAAAPGDKSGKLPLRSDFDGMMDQVISAFSEMDFFKNVPDWRLKNYLKKILIRSKLDEYDTMVIYNVFKRIEGIVKRLKDNSSG